jgi:hypothetical protein
MDRLYSRPDLMLLRRVRVHGTRDALRARQQIERSLASVEGKPPGISPGAVLIVRRLIPVARASVRSQTSLGGRVSLALRQHASQARRPWLDGNAATAETVLFIDEAELVACLVRDWLRGWVAERWWWRSVLWNQSVQEWLRQHVLPRGELLVPVLSLLAAGSEAVGWVRQLENAEAERAIDGIQRAYAVPRIDSSIPTPPRPRPSRDHDSVQTNQHRGHILETRVALERLVATVPEARAPGLGAPQRRLLALALVLTRAPAWARAPEFAAVWELLDHADLVSDIRATTSPGQDLHSETLQRSSTPSTAAAAPVGESGARLPMPGERDQTQAPTSVDNLVVPHAHLTPHVAPLRLAPFDGPQQATEAVPPSISKPPTEPAAADILPTTATQFGGLFYLLNAALALGLYGDFTAPRAPNLALSPWNWLALIGRSWFGAGFESDPLWKVLASLAGRSADQPPDHEFTAPTTWVIDQAWLKPWGRVPCLQYRATRSRLRVLHPSAFVLFDVPRDPHNPPLAQARHLCRRCPSLRDAAIEQATGTTRTNPARSPTARWLAWLLPYLEARLARSLGTDPDAVPALVCRHDARITASLTSVDVHLSLAALPLAIRIAGLDRDPGWIPAAGRAIAFHFV